MAPVKCQMQQTLVSQRITTIKRDESYAPDHTAEFFTDEVLQRWNDLMPRYGFSMGERYVKASRSSKAHRVFAIIQTYLDLTSGHEIPDDYHWHMIHCFDYLRQAIMCSSDVALEGPETTFTDP
ncbi:uncharacterized protein F4812DRAFT_455116 [Daldinia caldariorum]|uniref:uncharacterized protein n=1 Tax=Daldinia caldariorum TaxID=326644 RepID=UPI002008C836|nr:uncharacterized protein F4812DRAFT_455116 [Daldinia caldariorum]KAI1471005.1 hypothetical protein F4812DRAFT_455116 [Daldinia caldariorum]